MLLGMQAEAPVAEVKSETALTPGINLLPPPKLRPPSRLIPPVKLTGGTSLIPGSEFATPVVREGKRNFTLRKAQSASEGHSRAEEQVYQALWTSGEGIEDGSRIVTIGYVSLGRMALLSESNARINLRTLVKKLAVEEYSTYQCEAGRGRTWRVFSPEKVMERRLAAGLVWYMKRTLALVFVDPETGNPVLN